MHITAIADMVIIVGCTGGCHLALVTQELLATRITLEVVHCPASFEIVYVPKFAVPLMQVYLCGFLDEHFTLGL